MFGNDLTATDSFGTPRKEPPDPWKAVHQIKLKHEAVVNAAQTVVNCAGWQGEQAPQFLAEAIGELKAALGRLHYTQPPGEVDRA